MALRSDKILRMLSDAKDRELLRDLIDRLQRLLDRLADEPESKPPPETEIVYYDENGCRYFPDVATRQPRPDLAGQTFTYRLEKK